MKHSSTYILINYNAAQQNVVELNVMQQSQQSYLYSLPSAQSWREKAFDINEWR